MEQGYNQAPVIQLKTNRGLAKYIFLSILTLGIYGLVVMCSLSNDINIIASKYDGKKTMNYYVAFYVLSVITLGIVPLVWMHRMSFRVGAEAERRELYYGFGARTFWLWNFLGSFIIVGPFIYYYKLFKAMNLISADYNVRG